MRELHTVSGTQVYTADADILGNGALSLLLKNEGTSIVYLYGGDIVINPNDPPLSLPNNSFGEVMARRFDTIQLTFQVGFTNKLVVVRDQPLTLKPCSVENA